MTEASLSIPYLRPPIQVEYNYTGHKSSSSKRLIYTIALGALAYYAPKTFFAASAGIVGYQIHHFNQMVHSVDKTKHQEIRDWTIHASFVMFSVGTVFMLKSFPHFWSSIKAVRHFHLIPSVSHFAKGIFLLGIGVPLGTFNESARELAKNRQWVAMEDYVENYPAKVQSGFMTLGKIGFFVSAIIPQGFFARILSNFNFVFSQFSSPEDKLRILKTYFMNPNLVKIPEEGPAMENWTYAIHQLQSLPIEYQLTLGPPLSRIIEGSPEKLRNELPPEVKLVLLNEQLKGFSKIPAYGEAHHDQWLRLVDTLQKLDHKDLLVLGSQSLLLIQASPAELISSLPENLRASALKICFQDLNHHTNFDSSQWALATRIFESLFQELKVTFGHDLVSLTYRYNEDLINKLSFGMKLIMLELLLKDAKIIPPPSNMFFKDWITINIICKSLTSDPSFIEDALKRIATGSSIENINGLPSPLKERMLALKSTS